MPKINKENLVLTYDSQGNLGRSTIEWIQGEFFQGVNLYRRYMDRLNYELAPPRPNRENNEYEQARKEFIKVNDNVALVPLTEEVIQSRITNNIRNQYGRGASPWWQISAEDTSVRPFVYPLEIKTVKKIKVKKREEA